LPETRYHHPQAEMSKSNLRSYVKNSVLTEYSEGIPSEPLSEGKDRPTLNYNKFTSRSYFRDLAPVKGKSNGRMVSWLSGTLSRPSSIHASSSSRC
jgi:hypothetical protein